MEQAETDDIRTQHVDLSAEDVAEVEPMLVTCNEKGEVEDGKRAAV